MDKPVSPVARLSCPSCNNALEIGGEIERFACMRCGTEYLVQRQGGIITLVPTAEKLQEEGYGEAAKRLLHYEVAQLEKDLEIEMTREVAGMPAFQLLRYDYARLGKINFVYVGFVNEKTLEHTFRALSVIDIDKLIEYYQGNPGSPTGEYLTKLRELKTALIEKQKLLLAES